MSIVTEGITINGKHSNTDFGLCINSRTIEPPVKKTIRKTVPFMTGFYDFSNLNGPAAWEYRNVQYVFDILESSAEAMEAKREAVMGWLGNVQDADIYDDTIPGYHFHGSFDSAQITEDWEYCQITVTFYCYPFKVADTAESISLSSGDNAVTLNGQSVFPTITASSAVTVIINGGASQTVIANTPAKLSSPLIPGENTVNVSGAATLTYYPEVF